MQYLTMVLLIIDVALSYTVYRQGKLIDRLRDRLYDAESTIEPIDMDKLPDWTGEVVGKLHVYGVSQKDYAIVTQSIGRIARTADKKQNPVCFDFVDGIGYLFKSYKKRCSTYKKNGCYFVEEGGQR